MRPTRRSRRFRVGPDDLSDLVSKLKGVSLRNLPVLVVEGGSGHTAWRRLREWQDVSVWDRLHQLVLDELSNIDELDWTRGCIDAVSVRSKSGAS